MHLDYYITAFYPLKMYFAGANNLFYRTFLITLTVRLFCYVKNQIAYIAYSN